MAIPRGGKPEEFHKYLSTRENTPPPEGFAGKPVEPEKLLATVAALLA